MMILAYLPLFWMSFSYVIAHFFDCFQDVFLWNELVIKIDDQLLLTKVRLDVVDSREFILQTFQM